MRLVFLGEPTEHQAEVMRRRRLADVWTPPEGWFIFNSELGSMSQTHKMAWLNGRPYGRPFDEPHWYMVEESADEYNGGFVTIHGPATAVDSDSYVFDGSDFYFDALKIHPQDMWDFQPGCYCFRNLEPVAEDAEWTCVDAPAILESGLADCRWEKSESGTWSWRISYMVEAGVWVTTDGLDAHGNPETHKDAPILYAHFAENAEYHLFMRKDI